jgi:hypothetical protein
LENAKLGSKEYSAIFKNDTVYQFTCDEFPDLHQYVETKDRYSVPLNNNILEAISTDPRYPWVDEEEGHLQTVVDYIEKELVVFGGPRCKICKPPLPDDYVSAKEDPNDGIPSVVIVENTGNVNIFAQGISQETYKIDSKIIIFDVCENQGGGVDAIKYF